MKINDLDELDQLLELCHRRGVHTVVCGDLTVQLQLAAPTVKADAQKKEEFIDPATGLPMTEEELMFYASVNAPPRS